MTGETHWYAAIVRRQREAAACAALQAAGFVAYVPMETRIRRQPRKRISTRPNRFAPPTTETVEVPVVHGILFLGAPTRLASDLGTWWRLMQLRYPNSADAVLRSIYGNGGWPGEISEGEIEAMLAKRDKRVADLLRPDAALYAPKTDVRLTAGAFEGLRATVRELKPGTHRYIVMAQLLGGDVPVEVDEADIQPWAAE